MYLFIQVWSSTWMGHRGVEVRKKIRLRNLQRIKELMAAPNLVDGRNLLEREQLVKVGFVYKGVGRK